MKTFLALSTFIIITSLEATVSAQTSQTTEPKSGQVTTTEPSDKYGPGGTHSWTSDKKYRTIYEVYKDKCGRIRELYNEPLPPTPPYTDYYDENGKIGVSVTHTSKGDEYYRADKKLYSADGKALVKKLEKTPSDPCPEKTATAPESPEKPKEQPHPKAKPELPGGAFSPSLTPLAEPKTFNWTGFYIGVQVGYARSQSDYNVKLDELWNDFPEQKDEIEFRGMHEFDEDGFGVGGCAGYNYQFQNHVVIGAGIAGRKYWNMSDMFETGDFPVGRSEFDVWSSFNTTGLVTFGPKVGYAWGRVLPYVSGGLAFGELDASQKIFSSNFGGFREGAKASENRLGWNVSAGVQYALTNNWSLRVEYSYSDLGTFTYPGHSFPDTFHDFGTWHMATLTEHGANFGLVYNFGGTPLGPSH